MSVLVKSNKSNKVLPKKKGWDKIERKNILNNSKLHDGKLKQQQHFRHMQLNLHIFFLLTLRLLFIYFKIGKIKWCQCLQKVKKALKSYQNKKDEMKLSGKIYWTIQSYTMEN